MLGHFMPNFLKPNSVQLFQAKQQRTVKDANKLGIDLSNDTDYPS